MKLLVLPLIVLSGTLLLARQAAPQSVPPLPQQSNAPTEARDYQIGPLDVLSISVYGMRDMDKDVRVSGSGSVEFAPIGQVTAAGLSEKELSIAIEERLKKGFLNNPRVSVFVKEYASQPVSIVGAVRSPGSYQIMGEKTLIDMLAKAGDRTESAGSTIQVLRGDKTIVVNSIDLFQKGNSTLDIPIRSGDKINVLYAQFITVVGEVNTQGQFPLKYGHDVSVLDAWALAGGGNPNAKRKETVILREHENGKVEEIAVDMDKLLARQIQDVTMQPGDVLYVPASKVRTGVRRVMDSLISVGVGRAIYIR
jgi:polysaccharide export outer membrane protein